MSKKVMVIMCMIMFALSATTAFAAGGKVRHSEQGEKGSGSVERELTTVGQASKTEDRVVEKEQLKINGEDGIANWFNK